MTCYAATQNDSGKHYVGTTKRGLKTRRSQHERDAANKRLDVPFHNALRKHGKDAPSYGKLSPKAKMGQSSYWSML